MSDMKVGDITVHVSIGQYEFVEFVAGDVNDAAEYAKDIKAAFSVGEGISDKEFNAVVDAMMCAESVKNGSEIWPRMSAEQQAICQAIKKSSKRINSKLKKAGEVERT